MTKNLILKIPEHLNLNEKDVKRFMAAKMYERGTLSLGQAADLAGLSKVAFSEILADYDVALPNYPASEIERDADQF